MDIYLTNLETNECMRFPMLPDEITAKTASDFYDYKIINVGEIKIPSGEMLTGFSWSGKLPGKFRKNEPYIKGWIDPHETQSKWSFFRKNKTKLRLLITETPINHDVYLSSYDVTYSGGYGDYDYSIEFIQAKELKIYESKSGTNESEITQTDEPEITQTDEDTNHHTSRKSKHIYLSPADGSEAVYYDVNLAVLQRRTSPPEPNTYTVADGDSLWSVAEKMMGAGNEYFRLYSANKDVIDPANQEYGTPRYTIYPGQVLTIPR